MEYNIQVFSRLYPVLNDFIYHFISYKEIRSSVDELPLNKEFWVMTCDAHIKVAVTSWCMIFGATETNPTHWKHLKSEEGQAFDSAFNEFLISELGISKKKIEKYVCEMLKFRNKYVVHRELDFDNPVPYFDLAFGMAVKFDIWVREVIKPDFIDSPTLDIISKEYRTKIKKLLSFLVNK